MLSFFACKPSSLLLPKAFLVEFPFCVTKRAFSSTNTAGRPGEARKIALVTGASRGIGKAIALALADAGCNVVVNYSNSESDANKVVDEIHSRAAILGTGAKGFSVKADVTRLSDVEAMFSQAIEQVF
jgi:NADP-dependent 3-hydroxy acid dehydrogenase YdfG